MVSTAEHAAVRAPPPPAMPPLAPLTRNARAEPQVLFVEVMCSSGPASAFESGTGPLRKLSERATPSALVVLSSVIELLDTVVEGGGAYKVETIGSE